MIGHIIGFVAVRRLLLAVLGLSLVLGVQAIDARPARAEVVLYYDYFCSRTMPGAVGLDLSWGGVRADASQVWLDFSHDDDSWTAYRSLGYVAGTGSAVELDGFEPWGVYYFRISQLLDNGRWDTSPTFAIPMVSCTFTPPPFLPDADTPATDATE